MTTLEQVPTAELDVGDLETRQERARRRIARLDGTFQSVFEILAEIYRDEDWRYVNDTHGAPYTGFTAFVQDRLGCAASNARRYQQGISTLVLPLQEITAPGARIPITATDVVRLGVTGARVVVEEAPAALEGVDDLDDQTQVLRTLIDSVAKRDTAATGFGPIRPSTLPTSAAPLGALVPAELPPADVRAEFTTATTNSGDAEHRIPTAESPMMASPDSAAPTDDHAGDEAVAAASSQAPEREPDPVPGQAPPAAPPPATTVDEAMVAELDAAVAALLGSAEPVILADHLSGAGRGDRAHRYLTAAQKLARLGQLLRSMS